MTPQEQALLERMKIAVRRAHEAMEKQKSEMSHLHEELNIIKKENEEKDKKINDLEKENNRLQLLVKSLEKSNKQQQHHQTTNEITPTLSLFFDDDDEDEDDEYINPIDSLYEESKKEEENIESHRKEEEKEKIRIEEEKRLEEKERKEKEAKEIREMKESKRREKEEMERKEKQEKEKKEKQEKEKKENEERERNQIAFTISLPTPDYLFDDEQKIEKAIETEEKELKITNEEFIFPVDEDSWLSDDDTSSPLFSSSSINPTLSSSLSASNSVSTSIIPTSPPSLSPTPSPVYMQSTPPSFPTSSSNHSNSPLATITPSSPPIHSPIPISVYTHSSPNFSSTTSPIVLSPSYNSSFEVDDTLSPPLSQEKNYSKDSLLLNPNVNELKKEKERIEKNKEDEKDVEIEKTIETVKEKNKKIIKNKEKFKRNLFFEHFPSHHVDSLSLRKSYQKLPQLLLTQLKKEIDQNSNRFFSSSLPSSIYSSSSFLIHINLIKNFSSSLISIFALPHNHIQNDALEVIEKFLSQVLSTCRQNSNNNFFFSFLFGNNFNNKDKIDENNHVKKIINFHEFLQLKIILDHFNSHIYCPQNENQSLIFFNSDSLDFVLSISLIISLISTEKHEKFLNFFSNLLNSSNLSLNVGVSFAFLTFFSNILNISSSFYSKELSEYLQRIILDYPKKELVSYYSELVSNISYHSQQLNNLFKVNLEESNIDTKYIDIYSCLKSRFLFINQIIHETSSISFFSPSPSFILTNISINWKENGFLYFFKEFNSFNFLGFKHLNEISNELLKKNKKFIFNINESIREFAEEEEKVQDDDDDDGWINLFNFYYKEEIINQEDLFESHWNEFLSNSSNLNQFFEELIRNNKNFSQIIHYSKFFYTNSSSFSSSFSSSNSSRSSSNFQFLTSKLISCLDLLSYYIIEKEEQVINQKVDSDDTNEVIYEENEEINEKIKIENDKIKQRYKEQKQKYKKNFIKLKFLKFFYNFYNSKNSFLYLLSHTNYSKIFLLKLISFFIFINKEINLHNEINFSFPCLNCRGNSFFPTSGSTSSSPDFPSIDGTEIEIEIENEKESNRSKCSQCQQQLLLAKFYKSYYELFQHTFLIFFEIFLSLSFSSYLQLIKELKKFLHEKKEFLIKDHKVKRINNEKSLLDLINNLIQDIILIFTNSFSLLESFKSLLIQTIFEILSDLKSLQAFINEDNSENFNYSLLKLNFLPASLPLSLLNYLNSSVPSFIISSYENIILIEKDNQINISPSPTFEKFKDLSLISTSSNFYNLISSLGINILASSSSSPNFNLNKISRKEISLQWNPSIHSKFDSRILDPSISLPLSHLEKFHAYQHILIWKRLYELKTNYLDPVLFKKMKKDEEESSNSTLILPSFSSNSEYINEIYQQIFLSNLIYYPKVINQASNAQPLIKLEKNLYKFSLFLTNFLILEEGVTLKSNPSYPSSISSSTFSFHLSSLISSLPSTFDVLFLSFFQPKNTKKYKETLHSRTKSGSIYRVNYVTRTSAYILSLKGIEKLNQSLPITCPLDLYFGMLLYLNELEGYIVKDSPLIFENKKSYEVEGDLIRSEMKSPEKNAFKVKKFKHENKNSIQSNILSNNQTSNIISLTTTIDSSFNSPLIHSIIRTKRKRSQEELEKINKIYQEEYGKEEKVKDDENKLKKKVKFNLDQPLD